LTIADKTSSHRITSVLTWSLASGTQSPDDIFVEQIHGDSCKLELDRKTVDLIDVLILLEQKKQKMKIYEIQTQYSAQFMYLTENGEFSVKPKPSPALPNDNARKIISHCIMRRFSIFEYNVVLL